MRKLLLATMGAALGACGDSSEDGPFMPASMTRTSTVSLRVEYRASTVVTEEWRAMHRACANTIGGTHFHPSWLGFDTVTLQIAGPELWSREAVDVPGGRRHRLRVNDVNACDTHIYGAVTEEKIYVNGVLLVRPAITPGLIDEPGFSFFVDDQGVVSP